MDDVKITTLEPEVATAGRCSWNTDVDTKPILTQALPIAGGVVAGVAVGYLLIRFVVKPIINKATAKKEAKAEETPVAEEPKKSEE